MEWIASLKILKLLNVLNKTDTEVCHIVSPFSDDLVQNDIIDRKRMSSYNRSVSYIKSSDTRDPSTLISKDMKWNRSHLLQNQLNG